MDRISEVEIVLRIPLNLNGYQMLTGETSAKETVKELQTSLSIFIIFAQMFRRPSRVQTHSSC